jgi:hypothetical protein
MNLKPLATLDGSGGTYILRAPTKQNVAVFKPSDEEPYASNNPRGFLPSADITMRTGHIPGTGCYREVAAYLLDHGGLCGVPETTLAEASHRAFNVGGRYDTVASGGGAKGTHSIVTPAQGQKAGGGRETPMKVSEVVWGVRWRAKRVRIGCFVCSCEGRDDPQLDSSLL